MVDGITLLLPLLISSSDNDDMVMMEEGEQDWVRSPTNQLLLVVVDIAPYVSVLFILYSLDFRER